HRATGRRPTIWSTSRAGGRPRCGSPPRRWPPLTTGGAWSTAGVPPGGLGDLMVELLSCEVIPNLPPGPRELLRVGGALATFDANLLGHLGVPHASDAIAAARTRGI